MAGRNPVPGTAGTRSHYVGEDQRSVPERNGRAADGSVLWDGYSSDRDKELRRTYGLKLEQYEAILAAQGGVCGWCGRPPGRRALVVDHDHVTGEIRGLLCDPCNRRLTERGVAYLLDPPARHLGPFFVPADRLQVRRQRNKARAARRAATTEPAVEPASKLAERVARVASRQGGKPCT